MRHLLVTSVVVALLATSGGPVAAQEASPEPSPSAYPIPPEVEIATEPLPVADYWGEWNLHKRTSRERVRWAVDNAKNARARQVGHYRTLVGVHNDERRWLANHQPEACYADEYERWRVAVEELHALAKKSIRVARKDDASGLKRIAKQRRPITKQLDRLLSQVADCVDSEPPAISGDPFVGSWTSRPVTVAKDGYVDRSVRKLTISDSGRLLLRIPRNAACRELGYGLVPLSIHGKGEMVAAASPEFHWTGEAGYCHPRSGRKLVGNPGGPHVWDYDAATDVMPLGSECYWRTDSGSPKDCARFWRGEQPTVPALVGLDTGAASEALREAGLAGVPKEVFSETVSPGKVVSQGLAPGTTVDKGRSIAYSVSVGPEADAVENDPAA